MVLVNKSINEMTLKMVYYGPGLSGKTTNLQYIHKKSNPQKRGKLLSVATKEDRTLFFDLLPMEVGKVEGMNLRLQVYTVPGQVFYDATRRLVLKGADGVIFVADSQKALAEANVESMRNLQKNLLKNNLNPDRIPLVLQFNKRDLDDIMEPEKMYRDLAYRDDLEYFLSCAITGKGVHDTLKEGVARTVNNLRENVNHELDPEEAQKRLKAFEEKSFESDIEKDEPEGEEVSSEITREDSENIEEPVKNEISENKEEEESRREPLNVEGSSGEKVRENNSSKNEKPLDIEEESSEKEELPETLEDDLPPPELQPEIFSEDPEDPAAENRSPDNGEDEMVETRRADEIPAEYEESESENQKDFSREEISEIVDSIFDTNRRHIRLAKEILRKLQEQQELIVSLMAEFEEE